VSAILLACLRYVERACEGTPFYHVFRVSARPRAISRMCRRIRLCVDGDRCALCWVYSCVEARNVLWDVSSRLVSPWSRALSAPLNDDVYEFLC
jgi:hypothetical protein